MIQGGGRYHVNQLFSKLPIDLWHRYQAGFSPPSYNIRPRRRQPKCLILGKLWHNLFPRPTGLLLFADEGEVPRLHVNWHPEYSGGSQWHLGLPLIPSNSMLSQKKWDCQLPWSVLRPSPHNYLRSIGCKTTIQGLWSDLELDIDWQSASRAINLICWHTSG